MEESQFAYSSFCFQALVMMNKDAQYACTRFCDIVKLSVYVSKHLEVAVLDYMEGIC
jgi:hypothetical protein